MTRLSADEIALKVTVEEMLGMIHEAAGRAGIDVGLTMDVKTVG